MIKFDAGLFAKVAKFAPKFDIRSYLQGVRIEPHHEHGAVAVATNGHILAALYDPDGVCDEPMTLRCTEDLVAACEEGKTDGSAKRMVVVDSGKTKVILMSLDGTAPEHNERYVLPNNPALEGQYPNWRKIISGAKGSSRGMSACISANYLRKFASVARDQRFSAIDFWQSAEGDRASTPVYVQIERMPGFIGVIMPLTRSETVFPPLWLDLPQKEEIEAQP